MATAWDEALQNVQNVDNDLLTAVGIMAGCSFLTIVPIVGYFP